MKLYRLLLLDIDGTLRHERFGIPDSARQAIQQCREKNCQVVICTGRSIGTIQDDVLEIDVDGYIAGGGSYLIYRGELMCNQAFEQAQMQRVVKYLKTCDVAFTIESQENVMMNEKARMILNAMNASKQTIPHSNKQFVQEKIRYENNIAEFQTQPIHKLCLWSNALVYQNVANLLDHHFILAQQETLDNVNYYEILQQGFDKGDAVKRLQQKMNITKAQTICFGDGQNDLAMFQQADIAIAMKYSHKDAKQAATSICEDIFENGIYKELRRRKVL